MSKKIGITIVIILAILVVLAFVSFSTTTLSAHRLPNVGMVDKRIELVDSSCIAGNEAVMMVRNVGNIHLTLAPGGDVAVIDTPSGSDLGGSWYPLGSNVPTTGVEPGEVVWYNASCTGLCTFRLVVGGGEYRIAVQC